MELSVRNSVRGKGAAGSGLGLQNTKARLSHLFANEASFAFGVSDEGIASATLVFPALGMATAEETDGPRALQMKDAG